MDGHVLNQSFGSHYLILHLVPDLMPLISLLEIYRVVDAPKALAIHQYPVEKRCTVSCNIKSALGRVLNETQQAVEQRLSRISLAQVIADLRKK